jgi:hypothetical protein
MFPMSLMSAAGGIGTPGTGAGAGVGPLLPPPPPPPLPPPPPPPPPGGPMCHRACWSWVQTHPWAICPEGAFWEVVWEVMVVTVAVVLI